MMNNNSSKNRIAIFDDSIEALKRFEEKFDGLPVEILKFRSPFLDENIQRQLIEFSPNLIVADLIFGGFKEDGYQLLMKLREIEALKKSPIIICSKLINTSALGEKEKKDSLATPGVVDAFAKFPNYPPAEEFLKHIKEKR